MNILEELITEDPQIIFNQTFNAVWNVYIQKSDEREAIKLMIKELVKASDEYKELAIKNAMKNPTPAIFRKR